jgi:hypothetical protein
MSFASHRHFCIVSSRRSIGMHVAVFDGKDEMAYTDWLLAPIVAPQLASTTSQMVLPIRFND